MRYIKFILIFLLAFYPSIVKAEEIIQLYDTFINVNSDGSMDVTEDISINSEHKNIKLGIYRDIPKSYEVNGNTINTPVEVIYVNRNGEPENFWVEDHGSFLRVQIGAVEDKYENRLPFGSQNHYSIHWKTSGHIRGFKDYDELYFNVTGNDWIFPINQVSATVQLPSNVEIKQYAGYVGKKMSTEKASTIEGNNGQSMQFFTTRALKAGEGLTLAVGFSKGIIPTSNEATIVSTILDKIMQWGSPLISFDSSIVILGAFILLAYYMLTWFLYGKDEDLGTIVPCFNTPNNISIMEAATVYYGKRANKETSFYASIVSLASQGFITIKDKTIVKNPTDKAPKFAEEKLLLDSLFSKKDEIKLGSYTKSVGEAFANYLATITKTIKKYIRINNKTIVWGFILQIILLTIIPGGQKTAATIAITSLIGLFYLPFYLVIFSTIKSKNYLMATFLSLFIIPHSLAFLIGMPMAIINNGDSDISIQSFIFIILVMASLFIHVVFYYLMDKPLPEAVKILTSLEGLRMFMEITDKERYKVITPEIFERNLPYAIIFGLEKKWIETFKDLNPNYNPDWYDCKNTFSTKDIQSMHTSLINSSRQPSSSRGSGGGFGSSSGSGGGGSSGGGSGGGGGGGR